MIVVFVMAAVLWGMGIALKAPHRARWVMIGGLMASVLGLHLLLPDGHPLREGTGSEPELWLLILGFGGLIWLYRLGLRWLKSKQAPPPQSPTPNGPNPTELERNARHIVLREIGGPGQSRLKAAKVLVIGAGGLGASALQYLAAAGVGTIGVIDDDVVENSNLARQVIHRDRDIGLPKVFSAQAAMEAQNPFVTVRPFHRRLDRSIARDLFTEFDLILDGTDDTDTRYLVNETAVALGIPLISGALSQWEGQLTIFDPKRATPCYRCIFPTPAAPGLAPSCAQAGVLGPLPGIIGTMMAAEAIKLLSGAGTPLLGQMLIYDAQDALSRKIKLTANADCPVCGADAPPASSKTAPNLKGPR